MVYCVAGSRFFTGANDNTVPEIDRTNGRNGTGVPEAVCFSTRLACEIDSGFSGVVVVMVMTVLGGTPRAPSAGDTAALVTEPARRTFACVVCPAATWTEALPDKLVCGELTFRFDVPAIAGTMYRPSGPVMSTIGSESVWTRTGTGPALEETIP